MENVFVLQTDDKNFKESISFFLSSYCEDKAVNVAVYEMNSNGGKEVMRIVKDK